MEDPAAGGSAAVPPKVGPEMMAAGDPGMDDSRYRASTLGELAAALDAKLEPGSAATQPVLGLAGPDAPFAGALLFAENEAALAAGHEAGYEAGAAAILTTPELHARDLVRDDARDLAHDHARDPGRLPVLLVPGPKLAFARAGKHLQRPAPPAGVHPSASLAPGLQLPADVSVGPYAVVDERVQAGPGVWIDAGAVIGAGCVLGAGCHIYPRAVLYPGVELGARAVVHAGAVLGSDGCGYVRDPATGAYTQFPQQGRLVIEDDVEIGANTTVDRGALGETRIGRGTKIDNLVHIGHNVAVGADVVIAAQTGVSGSSRIGDGAVVAGQVGIADHVEIGAGAVLGAQCGVPSHKRIDGPGQLFWGTPARPIGQYLKELATLARLARAKRRA